MGDIAQGLAQGINESGLYVADIGGPLWGFRPGSDRLDLDLT